MHDTEQTEPRAAERKPGATETVVSLRWRDLDPYGHVNNAVYLTYLEEARDAAITRLLRGVPGGSCFRFVLARVEIDYRRELRLDDGPIVITCRVATVGGSSLRTRETIRTAAGELAAEAAAVVVKLDGATRRTLRWTEEERWAFAASGAQPRERAEEATGRRGPGDR